MSSVKIRKIDVKERFEICFEMRKHGWIILHFQDLLLIYG